jgi:hypothetical protein
MISSFSVRAQQVFELQENTPYDFNGLSYGYYITNERSKEVKGDDYERYELSFYVTNKSGCAKLIPFKTTVLQNGQSEEIAIAEFMCKNATGKRLTAKGGKVNALPWYAQAKVYDEAAPASQSSKYKMVNVQVGYAIKNGQTLTNRVIVIVPKGEKPMINCRTVYFPEM